MIKAVNIQWDTDEIKVDLPKEVEIPDGIVDTHCCYDWKNCENNSESVNNYLSDELGFCIFGYDLVEFLTRDKNQDLLCICENVPWELGFVPCDELGEEVDPTPEKWKSDLYVCDQCGRIFNIETLQVIGLRDSSNLNETYYSIRTVRATNLKEAVTKVQDNYFDETNELCDSVLTKEELIQELNRI